MMILFVRCVSDSEKSVYECSAVPSLGIGMGFERHPSNKMMLMLTASCHRISARYVYDVWALQLLYSLYCRIQRLETQEISLAKLKTLMDELNFHLLKTFTWYNLL